MRTISSIRRLLSNTRPLPASAAPFSSLSGRTLGLSMVSPTTAPQSPFSNHRTYKPSFQWFSIPTVAFSPLLNRKFCSNAKASPGPSNLVPIESEEQFHSSLRKAQDESLPTIFYFTAVWCGPCRLLSPMMGVLTEKYPNVTTYKVDIDHKDLGSALGKLNIHSVPTLHFFLNGKKDSEIIGADVQRIKDTMDRLYK